MLNKGDILGNQELLLTGDIRWRNPTKNGRFWQSILVAKKLWNLSTGARQTPSLHVEARRGHVSDYEEEKSLSDYFSSGSASSAPRRSKRRCQRVRRSAIHFSTRAKPFGSIWHVRTRPIFSEGTRPLSSRICQPWTTAASVMSSGSRSRGTQARAGRRCL